ncbi:hypothetical protein ACLOJK_028509 [Asimina triloba]
MDLVRSKASATSISPFDCLLFDLDDTLYSSNTGIAQACKNNIEDFLVKKCGFEAEKAFDLRIKLFRTYGSSLAGLRAFGYDIDADDYHSFVHGTLPYDRLKPDPRLRNILQSIAQRKIIFTNSDRNHAMKVVERIGLEDCFDEIICFETLNPNLWKSKRPDEFPVILKPSIEAIKIAIQVAGTDPRRTLFLDDSDRNIKAGKALGLRTALKVGKEVKSKEAEYLVDSISNLEKIIPEIWAADANGGLARSGSDMEMESMLEAPLIGA